MATKCDAWNIEYAVEIFPDGMNRKQCQALLLPGWIPYYEAGELRGRAYLSKVVPTNIVEGSFPMAEIKITRTDNDNTK